MSTSTKWQRRDEPTLIEIHTVMLAEQFYRALVALHPEQTAPKLPPSPERLLFDAFLTAHQARHALPALDVSPSRAGWYDTLLAAGYRNRRIDFGAWSREAAARAGLDISRVTLRDLANSPAFGRRFGVVTALAPIDVGDFDLLRRFLASMHHVVAEDGIVIFSGRIDTTNRRTIPYMGNKGGPGALIGLVAQQAGFPIGYWVQAASQSESVAESGACVSDAPDGWLIAAKRPIDPTLLALLPTPLATYSAISRGAEGLGAPVRSDVFPHLANAMMEWTMWEQYAHQMEVERDRIQNLYEAATARVSILSDELEVLRSSPGWRMMKPIHAIREWRENGGVVKGAKKASLRAVLKCGVRVLEINPAWKRRAITSLLKRPKLYEFYIRFAMANPRVRESVSFSLSEQLNAESLKIYGDLVRSTSADQH